jgi:hypothetical protein
MTTALLLASIQAVQDTYGVAPVSGNASSELAALVARFGN